MKHQHIDEQLYESAMHEVEMEFRVSGMVAPPPGFLQRWQIRLDKHLIATGRRQARIFVAIIAVIILGFFTLIGLRFVPALPSYGSFLSFWVNVYTQLMIFIKMGETIFETLFRTLPGLVPADWWINAIVSTGMLLLLWAGLMRQFVQKQGVLV